MRKNMKIGAFAFGTLVSAGLLSGCVITQPGFSQLDNEGKREHLGYAAAETPVYLKTANWSFAEGEAAASEAAARYASGSIFGSTAEFTSDPAKAKRPNYYVVLAINLPRSSLTTILCSDGPVPTDADAQANNLRITAAFCSGGQTLSSSTASGPAPAGVGDEAFRKLVRGAMQELFPIEKERDSDRTRGIIISG
ncbi:hypothetical protein NUH88_19510 [Nisaea acidiphila]|uniref:Lipoprotein n=1 Tax=Nisaea acidiphila TaxID=1862145 RepID=A0A9J7AQW6_9PROT|nr:hypothetical protein [Nisaea acidiphila]UUX49574.1 hypothetical protein NUH88_19510 [Nisaea acidiphila]